MIALALSMALQTASPAPPPPSSVPSDDDIVVVGERMRRLKLSLRAGRAGEPYRCRVKRPSGDAAFDVRMCAVSIACAPQAKTGEEIAACVRPVVQAYADELKARRAEAVRQTP